MRPWAWRIFIPNASFIETSPYGHCLHLHIGATPAEVMLTRPRNLLLDANWRVKICDLGMARLHIGGDDGKTQNAVGPLAVSRHRFLSVCADLTAVGRFHQWMAPEAFKLQFSTKSDVFSFGGYPWQRLLWSDGAFVMTVVSPPRLQVLFFGSFSLVSIHGLT